MVLVGARAQGYTGAMNLACVTVALDADEAAACDAAAAPSPILGVLADEPGSVASWCQALCAEGVAVHAAPTVPPQAQVLVLHCGPRIVQRLARLRELRAADSTRPLVVVCAGLRDMDQVLALEMGADEVLDERLAAPVVAARLRALWRRCTASAPGQPQRLAFGRLLLHLSERSVRLGDQRIDLTEAEFEVLWLLALHAGRAVSRDELLQRLRGLPYQRIDRSIDCRVYRLRAKLGDGRGAAQRIRTVRNCGYLFSPARW